MNHQVDCRDRTAEFFSTVQQIQKAQNMMQLGGASNGSSAAALLDGTGHRPLPSKSSYGGGSSGGFHSEFDERPDESLLGRGSSSSLLGNGNGSVPPPKQQSQFTQAAQHIGRSIHMVTGKLEKLGKRQWTNSGHATMR